MLSSFEAAPSSILYILRCTWGKKKPQLGFCMIKKGILIGSDRRPETKQGIEGKLIGSDRKGLGLRLGVGLGLGSYRRSEPDRRSEPNS